MSSSGATTQITDNLVINNVYAVNNDGTPQISGKVLVTGPGGLMTYQAYSGGDVWYTVPAETNVDMSGNSIIKCPNMVSQITSTGGTNNCISLTSGLDGSGNKSYNIATNIQSGTGISISQVGSTITINNTDTGSAWYTVPALTSVDMSGNNINKVTAINGYGGNLSLVAATDISGSLNVNGPISNSLGNVVINDTLDLSGNNIIKVGDISGNGTFTATNLNFTGNLQKNGVNQTIVNSVSNAGNGSGIDISGTLTAPTVRTNLKAGTHISLVPSGIDSSITIDVNGGGASQWVTNTTTNSISYTDGSGSKVGIGTTTPLASLDAEGGQSNTLGQYFITPGSYTVTIPAGALTMYFEILGAGGPSGGGNGGYVVGTINVGTITGSNLVILVGESNSSSYPESFIYLDASNNIVATNGSSGSVNGTVSNVGFSSYSYTEFNKYSGVALPNYLLTSYGRAGQNGMVYISFGQPSIRAVGDIIAGGNIVTQGLIIGGQLLLNYLYQTSSTSYDPIIPGAIVQNPFNTSYTLNFENVLPFSFINYVKVKIVAVGAGGNGVSASSTTPYGGGGGGSGQEVSGLYYVPVVGTTLTINLGQNSGTSIGRITRITDSNNNIIISCAGGQDGNTNNGGSGWYGGGGGAGGGGGSSIIFSGIRNGNASSGIYGGDGDGPYYAGNNITVAIGKPGSGGNGSTTTDYGGGGGGCSSIGVGGDGGNTDGSKGYNGGGGGGGSYVISPLSTGNGGYGGDGAVWIQIFSV